MEIQLFFTFFLFLQMTCFVRFYKMDGSMKETQVVQIVRSGCDHVTLLTPFEPGHVYTSVRLSLQPQGWLLYLRELLHQRQTLGIV